MTISIEQFNKEVKVIKKQLVSLPESWESNGEKYQVKFGDILKTVDISGNVEYLLYNNLSEAYRVKGVIETLLNKVEKIEDLDLNLVDIDWDNVSIDDRVFYFEEEIKYFKTTFDDEGLIVPMGVEGLDNDNIVSVELIYIHDLSTENSYVDEWKGKKIVTDCGSSWGKLGDKTNIEGVFIGDSFELCDPNWDTEELDTFVVVEGYKGEYLLSSYTHYDIPLNKAFEMKDDIKLKKVKSYKNLNDSDAIWIGEGFYVE